MKYTYLPTKGIQRRPYFELLLDHLNTLDPYNVYIVDLDLLEVYRTPASPNAPPAVYIGLDEPQERLAQEIAQILQDFIDDLYQSAQPYACPPPPAYDTLEELVYDNTPLLLIAHDPQAREQMRTLLTALDKYQSTDD